MIYFDNAATSFYKPENVKNGIIKNISSMTANPGRGGHNPSKKVAEKIFDTREVVKQFFCANNYDVIFTKNCTEALNLAIFGNLKSGDNVIISCFEHNSVLRPIHYLKSIGVELTIIEDDLQNFHTHLEREIKSNTKMVVCSFVSNVTGDYSYPKKISEICKSHNVLYLIDGAQACGHLSINLDEIDADMMAFAGHKGLLAITGVGGLLKKSNLNFKPLTMGGTGTDSANLNQPTDTIEGYESGTIPSISIMSLGDGIKFLSKNFSEIQKKEAKLTKYLISELKKLKFLTIYSKDDSKNVVSFNFKNCDSTTISNILNEKFGICVRSGLHCAPLAHKQLGTQDCGTVRVSLDFNNSISEIDKFVQALKTINNYS